MDASLTWAEGGLLLPPDLTEAASDLSPMVSAFSLAGEFKLAEDALGLSCDRGTDPGIFDFIELRNDLEEPWVSDFENDGYESRFGPSPVGVLLLAPGSPFDGWLPMFKSYS